MIKLRVFVVVLLIFNNLSAVFFAEEMAMALVNSAEPELNETQGYAINRSTQIWDYHSIVCHHLLPTNRTSTPELNKVWFSR